MAEFKKGSSNSANLEDCNIVIKKDATLRAKACLNIMVFDNIKHHKCYVDNKNTVSTNTFMPAYQKKYLKSLTWI